MTLSPKRAHQSPSSQAGSGGSPPKVLFVIPEDWFFWTHRRALGQYLASSGCDVVVACRVQEHAARLEGLGVRVVPLRQRRSSRNPIRELAAIWELFVLYRKERPDLVHHTAIKPVIYGSIAAALARVQRVVNAIPGLGHVFTDRGFRAALVRGIVTSLYRVAIALNRPNQQVIFENPENRDTLVSRKVAHQSESAVILGMGCDTREFAPEKKAAQGEVVVALAGRLLWSKGVGELVEAAEIVRNQGVSCTVSYWLVTLMMRTRQPFRARHCGHGMPLGGFAGNQEQMT